VSSIRPGARPLSLAAMSPSLAASPGQLAAHLPVDQHVMPQACGRRRTPGSRTCAGPPQGRRRAAAGPLQGVTAAPGVRHDREVSSEESTFGTPRVIRSAVDKAGCSELAALRREASSGEFRRRISCKMVCS
jgi:hypothetical protein